MSFLIKGMEMPKENAICVVIFPDGEVTSQFGVPYLGTAVPVLPHGRLGDLDELENRIKAWMQTTRRAMTEDVEPYVTAVLRGIQETPTIIPAEETSNCPIAAMKSENEHLKKTNERLKKKIDSLQTEINQLKSDISWDLDARYGNIQGMW